MKRWIQIGLFLAFFLPVSSSTAGPPNILVIMLDDSGWTDFGCYGSQIDTPHIDRLVQEGMRLTDCHAAAANCSPSRAGLLTGRTPSRVGMYSYRPPNHPMHLRDEEITIAEILKKRGYHTGHFGKWHLSTLLSDQQPSPADQGFDHSLGTDNNARPSHLNPVNFVRNGKQVSQTEGYSCQIVVDEAIGWLNRIGAGKGSDPFFACIWYHEPHTPIASPKELVKKYQAKFPNLSNKDATYYANIENVDRATGRLLDHIEKVDLDEETLVLLTSDNGGLNRFSTQGLRGRKSHLWEGGHRVPGIFRWSGTIKAGTECSIPISGVDLLPTICELTDAELPNDRVIDGTSLAGILTGKTDTLVRQTPLYWFFYRLNPALALREGRWALIAETNDAKRPKTHALIAEDMPFIKASRPERFLLFDLESDLSQGTDVSQDHPEVLKRLRAKALQLHAEVISEGPVWELPKSRQKRRRRIWDSY